jgi:hypothetical protein
MEDPFGQLEDMTLEMRIGFELGMVWADMMAGGRGPWIVRDGYREVYEKSVKKFGYRPVFEDYDDQENCPVPLVVISAEKIGLRLV